MRKREKQLQFRWDFTYLLTVLVVVLVALNLEGATNNTRGSQVASYKSLR